VKGDGRVACGGNQPFHGGQVDVARRRQGADDDAVGTCLQGFFCL
jgi:hypothetical protein